MKKIIYSNYTKFIAVILFIISIVSGTLIVTDGISDFFDEDVGAYNFESDFSESKFLSSYLDAPENVIFNAYHSLYESVPKDAEANTPNTGLSTIYEESATIVRTKITPNAETIEKNIEQRLNDLHCDDKIDYYIKWNDRVFTNCGATTAKELTQGDFYSYITMEKGNIERYSEPSHNKYSGYPLEEVIQYDEASTITMATKVKDDVVAEFQEIWERQAGIVNDTLTEALFFVVLAILLLIYLICVCGKNKDGEQKTNWIDNVWAEVHLAAMVGFALGVIVLCAIIYDEFSTGHFPHNLTNIVIGTASAVASAVCLTSILSIIRNIKCKKFVQTSIIARIVKRCWQITVKLSKWFWGKLKSFKKITLYTLSKKTGVILISMLFAYTALIGLFGIFTLEAGNPFWIFVGIALFVGASFLVAHRAKDIDEIKKGVSEVRNGNVAYKIPELKSEDMRALATNINDIAKGLDESVSAKVKAERLKTELITNVSHDLKTPITSIINYTELLSKIEELPEEAKDYVSVISKKSERLKTLTQDLFDISKAQSGNEEIIFEKLDAELLINQSLAEYDSEIQKSELVFCVNTSKDLYFQADGRKMSRVIGNLINNILKYSLKNTRVFITAAEKGGEVVMEFKNIALYPMNFNADEIAGRFVRGDESRTQEGNGLGLAIAKSYTEICNGKFEIVLDGDMFKAILKFRKEN